MLEASREELERAGAAILAAQRWARQFLISKRGFEAAVSGTRLEPVELIRIRWRGRTRRIVVRQAITGSRARKIQEPLDPGSLDPWEESPESLAARPRQISRCRICAGEKRVRCLTCRGSALVACDACGGSGSIWSSRSRRRIACRTCRGTGERRCSCRDGWISCGPCGGKGKVEEWLEVTDEPFDRITVAGSGSPNQAPPGFDNPDTFDAVDRFPILPFLSWRGRTVEDAPAEVRSFLRRPDLAGAHPREDRLQEVALQVLHSEITTVIYQLAGLSGSVQVQAWDRRVIENSSSREPFRRRLGRTVLGVSVAAFAGASLAIWYGGRHSFFASTPNHWLLWVLALVFSLSMVPLMLYLALPAGGRQRKGAVAASLPVLLVALAQTGLAATGGPSLDHARASAARGDFEAAIRESAACFDLGVEPASAGHFHDELQLERIRQADEPKAAWQAASLTFLTEAARKQAGAHAVEVTYQASAALQERGELAASAVLLDAAPAEIRLAEPLVGLRRRVFIENALPFWKVIEARRKSLEDRVAACKAIAPHIRGLASLPATPDDSSPLTEGEVRERCENLREQRLREIERQREAEAREAERTLRRAEAAREAAQRRWASAPLRCNDGMLSPSCVCGGSHRGCCSWHGGVAGCSVDYPN